MQFSKSTVTFAKLIPGILIIIGTVFGAWYLGNKVMNDEINVLLIRAKNIAISIPDENFKQLSGTSSDMGTVVYDDLKQKLVDLHSINSDTRFIYLMGLQGDTQFFYMDSENPTSKDYSPPGQVYSDAMPVDIANHKNGTPYTNGPYTDKWGTWISAYAPVTDNFTGEVVAMLGIDADADSIYSKVLLSRIIILIIGIFLFASVFFLNRVLQNLMYNKSSLEEKNLDLETQKVYLEEAQSLAKLGQMNVYVPREEVLINSYMSEILNLGSKSKISINDFFHALVPEDANRIQNQIMLLRDNDRDHITFTYHVPKENGKVHTVASLCKIKRDSHGGLLQIVCSAQDITEHIS